MTDAPRAAPRPAPPAAAPRPAAEAEPDAGLERMLAGLLGAQLAEIEARIDAWGRELRQGAAGAPFAAAPPPPRLKLAPLHRLDPAAGWAGWSGQQGATLHPGGIVELPAGARAPGATGPLLKVPARGLLCLRVTLDLPGQAEGIRPVLRMLGEGGEQLGAELPLAGGTAERLVFVPGRHAGLRVAVVALAPKPGLRIGLGAIEVLEVDPDSHQALTRHEIGAPVIASMASIPDRREMLADAVASLLAQCDRVRVFLNHYPDVPEFLAHPRIDIRRSQDWDDKGDAGKFGWIDLDEPPGYRVIVDDDLVFPPDFAQAAVAAVRRHGDHAFVGLHGVLLRQPLVRYYDPASRHVFHFANPLNVDTTVHVLGTNAFCHHSATLGLRWADFQHCNMADIFVATHAQARGIPMVAMARARNWVQQNRTEGRFETIYENSLKGTRSRFDSSLPQDALVRRAWPVTLQPTPRPKLVVCLLATQAAAAAAAWEAWLDQAGADIDWAFVICPLGEEEALQRWAAGVRGPHELHVVQDITLGPAARLRAAVALAVRLGGQVFCIATDALRPAGGGWAKPAVAQLRRNDGLALFVHADAQAAPRVLDRAPASGPPAPLAIAPPWLAAAAGEVDIQGGDPMAALADWLARLSLAQPGGPRGKEAPEVARHLVVAPGQRPAAPAPPATAEGKVGWRRVVAPPPPGRGVNDLFERVVVPVPERQPERWAAMQPRLARAGIRALRVAAADPQSPALRAEYEAYAAQPLAQPPADARPVTSLREFHFDHDSQAARIAFEEARRRRKAIGSAAAWATLVTWQRILEEALAEGVETLLVLADDVAFHRDAPALFAAVLAELPAEWLMLQLGARQAEWERPAATAAGRHLYRGSGAAAGSHAVGLRAELLPFMLDMVKRRDMPLDIGAVSAAGRAWRDRCFVVTPNLAIQPAEEAEPGAARGGRDPADPARSLRWHLPDYDL